MTNAKQRVNHQIFSYSSVYDGCETIVQDSEIGEGHWCMTCETKNYDSEIFLNFQNFGHKKTPDFSGVGFLSLYYVPRTI
jgi:hypothetical protein